MVCQDQQKEILIEKNRLNEKSREKKLNTD